MNGHQIRKLIKQYNKAEEDYCYYDYKDHSDDTSDEWGELRDIAEIEMFHLQDRIIEAKPSKYMIEKYPELEYFLSL